jgi:hypothetical protein
VTNLPLTRTSRSLRNAVQRSAIYLFTIGNCPRFITILSRDLHPPVRTDLYLSPTYLETMHTRMSEVAMDLEPFGVQCLYNFGLFGR